MADDGGLQNAVDAARAAEEELDRLVAEDEARQAELREAGRSFVARMRAAGISPEVVRVHVGWEEDWFGILNLRKRKTAVYEQRVVWVIRPHTETYRYDVGQDGIYVLEDGTIVDGKLEQGRAARWPRNVLPALGKYLLDRHA